MEEIQELLGKGMTEQSEQKQRELVDKLQRKAEYINNV